MRSSLAAIARFTRLGNRGLGNVLAERMSGLDEPWILRSIQAHSTTTAASPSVLDDAPSTSGSADASPPSAAAAKLPPGMIDFERRQLVMMFTCGKCETRAAKAFSKMAYQRGVVLVECPGCNVRHLIADHLGWFGTKGTVEDFAAERGDTVVTRLADNTLELTPEDMWGGSAQGGEAGKS